MRTGARLSAMILAMAVAALVGGCAGSLGQLHWYGGDVFGVASMDGGVPSRIQCPGATEQRFACFSEKLRQRSESSNGAFVVVDQDGRLLDMTMTEPSRGAPTTPDSLFPLASITKMVTAAAAVRLSQDGVLELDRPISSYISEITAESDLGRVTVHQLLTHTAGLLDPVDQPLCVGDGELSAMIARAHIAAAPGAVYLYSNTGYALVGLVLERATGSRFEDVVRERVLQPMGMVSATFDQKVLRIRGHAARSMAPKRCRAMYPAGGLIASARELAGWAHAMTDPDTHPLGRDLVEALTASYVATGDRPGETYGYGVATTFHGGLRIQNHGGNLDDSSAFVAWVPERRFAAGAVSQTPGGAPAVAVLRGLSVFLDLPDDWRPSASGRSHPLTAYLGTYVDRRSSLGRVRVRLDGDRLAYDYVDRRPPLLPAMFRFRFEPGDERAKFLVTAVGVAERIAEE